MSSAAIAVDTEATVTQAELGWKFVRGGLMLFLVGFLTGFVPLLHYWHGAVAGDVGPLFLKNMTLWWGCPAVLAELTLKAGSLGMIAIGVTYLMLARDGSTTPASSRERGAVTWCYYGLIAELVTAAVFYVVCNMIWPNFYFTPVQDGKNLWLLVQAISIGVYVYGVHVAVTSLRKATPRLAHG
jgi:hypothetical protein